MPDGSVILKLYERRPDGPARHLRVSLAQWLAGRGVYLLEVTRRRVPWPACWPGPSRLVPEGQSVFQHRARRQIS